MADGSIFSPRGRAMGRRELEAMGIDTSKYEKEDTPGKTKSKVVKLSSVKPAEETIIEPSKPKYTNIKVRLSKLKSTPVSEESPTLKLSRPFNLEDFNYRGKGTYGCVFNPPIPCEDETVNRTVAKNILIGKKYVSKVLQGDDDDAKYTMDEFIRLNTIAKEAGDKAKRVAPGVSMDLGSEAYKCKLPEKYDLKPKCGSSFDASKYSLILEDLGKTDIFRPSSETKEDLLKLSEKNLQRMIASNIINLMKLHEDGYIHRDIKEQNILIDFEVKPSFKIIDYDLLVKIGFTEDEINLYYEFFDYYYYFPAEYYYIGNRIIKGKAITFAECFEDHMEELKKFAPLTHKRIRQIVKSYSSSGNFDEGLDHVYEENRDYLTEISVILRNPDRITKEEEEKARRLWCSLDFYMWAIAIYELVSSLKEVSSNDTKKHELDKILNTLEKYFHPIISERKIGTKEFVIKR